MADNCSLAHGSLMNLARKCPIRSRVKEQSIENSSNFLRLHSSGNFFILFSGRVRWIDPVTLISNFGIFEYLSILQYLDVSIPQIILSITYTVILSLFQSLNRFLKYIVTRRNLTVSLIRWNIRNVTI